MIRTALVTGGNRGIGLAIVKGLAQQHGLKVLLGTRNRDNGLEAARGMESKVIPVVLGPVGTGATQGTDRGDPPRIRTD